MKNKKFKSEWEGECHNEFVLFYYMCGSRDRAFFDAPEKERKIEDYARLTCIALSCGFKKMALSMMANLQNVDEFRRYLHDFPYDSAAVVRWLEDFVRETPDPEFRTVLANYWEEIREKIDKEDFDIKSLLF